MDYKHTIDILSENIKELAFIIDGFAANKRIPALELDLVLAKTRNLYDVLLMLKKYAVLEYNQELSEPAENKSTPASENEMKKEEIKTEKAIDSDLAGLEIPKSKAPNPAPADSKNETDENTVAPKILSDRFKKQPNSLHDDLIQSKPYYDLSAKLQSKPLANIPSAIGINERFSFIQELFQGNTDKYNKTMQVLNDALDFNEAYNYIIENFQWDMDSVLVQKILDLIRRKFITGKNE